MKDNYHISSMLTLVILTIPLADCASVDQFGGRLYDGNINSQSALNQETLLNILRASKYQTPNFIGLSQITGGQTETLSTGLPAINIGPHQTQAQQIYSVTNSLSSAATSTYQANPLLSTTFQEGMLFPITIKQLALLIGSHPREIVLNLSMDNIVVSRDGKNYKYRNDPTYNNIDQAGNYSYGVDEYCKSKLALLNPWSEKEIFEESEQCNYSKFVAWLQIFLDYGLTAQLVPTAQAQKNTSSAPSPGTNTVGAKSASSNSGTPTPTESTGKLCFDELKKAPAYTHGTSLLSCNKEYPVGTGKPRVPFTTTIENYGKITLEYIGFKSTLGMFDYTAKAWGNNDNMFFRSPDATTLNGPLVDIVASTGTSCYTSARFAGQTWCVPQDAEKTAVVLDIIQEMRNFNIQPSDLNSSFSVHVTN